MSAAPRLGIVLATATDFTHAAAIALAARRARIDVAVFAMADGVSALASNPVAVAELLAADCALTACATSVDGRGLSPAGGMVDAARGALPPGVVLGSQDDHAAILATSGRVIALT